MARADHSGNILQNLEKEYKNASAIYIEKRKLLDYLDDLQLIKRRSEKKPEKGEHSAELTPYGWEKKLDYRKEKGDEIVFEERGDDMIGLLTEVLQEAKAFKVSRNGDDINFESDSNVGDNRRETSLDNSCIDAGIQKVEESMDGKLCIINARIMKNHASAKKLELNFLHTSVFDYLAAIAPVL